MGCYTDAVGHCLEAHTGAAYGYAWREENVSKPHLGKKKHLGRVLKSEKLVLLVHGQVYHRNTQSLSWKKRYAIDGHVFTAHAKYTTAGDVQFFVRVSAAPSACADYLCTLEVKAADGAAIAITDRCAPMHLTNGEIVEQGLYLCVPDHTRRRLLGSDDHMSGTVIITRRRQH
jgi:hypothetical protein